MSAEHRNIEDELIESVMNPPLAIHKLSADNMNSFQTVIQNFSTNGFEVPLQVPSTSSIVDTRMLLGMTVTVTTTTAGALQQASLRAFPINTILQQLSVWINGQAYSNIPPA